MDKYMSFFFGVKKEKPLIYNGFSFLLAIVDKM